MVDKVARAIMDVTSVEGTTLPWEGITEGHRALLIEQAKAAIKAMKMRTPERRKTRSVDISDTP